MQAVPVLEISVAVSTGDLDTQCTLICAARLAGNKKTIKANKLIRPNDVSAELEADEMR